MQVFQYPCGKFQIDPFMHSIKDLLIAGFETEFQHITAGIFQAATEFPVGKLWIDTGKAIPLYFGRCIRQGLQCCRTDGVVKEMNKGRGGGCGECLYIGNGCARYDVLIWVILACLRAEAAFFPETAKRAGVGENETGRQVAVVLKMLIDRSHMSWLSLGSQKVEQGSLPLAPDKVIHQPNKRITPLWMAQPGCDQATAENYFHFRIPFR